MDVITQAVEQLRAVGLGIDGLHLDAFEIVAPFGTFGLGVQVDALAPFPHAGQRPQRAQIGQGVRIHVFRFGEDVVGEVDHRVLLAKQGTGSSEMAGRVKHALAGGRKAWLKPP